MDKLSRPKSAATLEREAARAERLRRKALVAQSLETKCKEADRERRRQKRLVHQSLATNGVPKVKQADVEIGFRNAIEYDPCHKCHSLIRENNLNHDCSDCDYADETERRTNRITQRKAKRFVGVVLMPEGGPGGPPMAHEGGNYVERS